MEFSLYLMNDTKQHIDEVFRLDHEMPKIGTTNVGIEVVVDTETYNYDMEVSFYYKMTNNPSIVDWGVYWNSLFTNRTDFNKDIESAFGAITISFEDRNYVIALGRSFSYVSKLCNMDFGLDLAEMSLSEERITVKSAKFFKKSKNKSLTQYRKSTYVTSEIGESDDFVIGNLNLESKYSQFSIFRHKESFKFGAAVKFGVGDYTPQDILTIVAELNKIYTDEQDNRQCSLPRLMMVKDNEDNQVILSDLDRNLLEDLISEGDITTTLSYFEIEGGEVIITPESNQRIKLVYDRHRYDVDFSISSISSRLRELECQDINIVSIRNEDTGVSKKLKVLLDYRNVYRGSNYCLYNGKWACFNQSYLDHVNREIQNVNSISVVDNGYDLTERVLERGSELRIELELDENVTYAEYQYNIFMSNRDDDKLLDRKRDNGSFKNVEFADIYLNDSESLMHVKIGGTKELRYCIEQSLRSAEIYSVHSDVLQEYGINNVKEVSMLFVTKVQNLFNDEGEVDFSRSSSLYFKVELIEWMNRVRSFNLNPKIYVAKDLR
ncbi:DUF6119 family protein [Vallitalea guaymasensis]|uniref:DUF6119 family protein n=1 Tax=Vallitalea guaymasensis TaxID=1185412 RepID=UPI002356B828|nr:DUF6119 family protein [Vallitalea guaymasensis]